MNINTKSPAQNCGAQTVRQASAIENAISDIQESKHRLTDNLQRLSNRLSVVSLPCPNECKSPSPIPNPSRSEINNILVTISEDINVLSCLVERMLSKLEI